MEIIAIYCEGNAKNQFVVDKALLRFSPRYQSSRTPYSFIHSSIHLLSTVYNLKKLQRR